MATEIKRSEALMTTTKERKTALTKTTDHPFQKLSYLFFHKLLNIKRNAVSFIPVKAHLGSFLDGFPVIFHRHIRSRTI